MIKAFGIISHIYVCTLSHSQFSSLGTFFFFYYIFRQRTYRFRNCFYCSKYVSRPNVYECEANNNCTQLHGFHVLQNHFHILFNICDFLDFSFASDRTFNHEKILCSFLCYLDVYPNLTYLEQEVL